jgi:predicted DNA-binding transcriptional regulator AlpA
MQKSKSHAVGQAILSSADSDMRTPETLKEVLTPEDLAELFNISVWTIYSKTSRRNRSHTNMDLPKFFKIGKLVRFAKKDVLEFLDSRKRIDPNQRGETD